MDASAIHGAWYPDKMKKENNEAYSIEDKKIMMKLRILGHKKIERKITSIILMRKGKNLLFMENLLMKLREIGNFNAFYETKRLGEAYCESINRKRIII